MQRWMILGLLFARLASAQTYTKDGEMVFPAEYRTWVYLSSGLGMTYSDSASANPHPNFDNVFVNHEAHAAFLKTGHWPDKTVMVLEVRSSATRGSINKGGHYQTEVAGVEVHVKDDARGGWAFYGFDKAGDKMGAAGKLVPKSASCYSCHEKSGATDTTFVQFYPTLVGVAKAKGTYRSTEE